MRFRVMVWVRVRVKALIHSKSWMLRVTGQGRYGDALEKGEGQV